MDIFEYNAKTKTNKLSPGLMSRMIQAGDLMLHMIQAGDFSCHSAYWILPGSSSPQPSASLSQSLSFLSEHQSRDAIRPAALFPRRAWGTDFVFRITLCFCSTSKQPLELRGLFTILASIYLSFASLFRVLCLQIELDLLIPSRCALLQ